MQFHEIDLFDFMSFFAWTFLKFLARCVYIVNISILGLIDGHTHPVWAGDRVHEFAMKLAGASYMEVHEAGGGINFTVEKTRAASEAELLNLLMDRLERMLKAQCSKIRKKCRFKSTKNIIRHFRNGKKKSIFAPEKSLKFPKMQFSD